jgi:glycosyltransferase involved in cell wall biosynthesis
LLAESLTMRIAQIAPLYESVPPTRYGGTERVVSWLTEELVARGHEVTLFASADSRTQATLVPVVDRALRLADVAGGPTWHALELAMAHDRAHEFDVIHSHVDHLTFPVLRTSRTPVVTTLHGRLDVPGLGPVLRHFDSMPLVSISDAQRDPIPDAGWMRTIYHGLPLEDYEVGSGRGDYVVFLGRISPEKRPGAAIDLARRAGVRLVIAAKVDPTDRAYFESVVEPRLREPGIDFVGEVDDAAKVRLLGDARALLFPILWPEPFGLAMIEALACGTPVLTRRCGSTPEVIDTAEVGAVCDTDAALLRAFDGLGAFDRATCRRRVEERFSVARMADEYETVYDEIVASARRDVRATRALLPTAPTLNGLAAQA